MIGAGVPVAVRLQPLIPGREEEARDFIDELAALGISHIGVEHLKLPVQGWVGTTRLGNALAEHLVGATRPEMRFDTGENRSSRVCTDSHALDLRSTGA